jgi:catechol 2,3-dioxygenase-like lactoylglutathione lyase family enzyme
MINGWLSLQVANPELVSEWYEKLGFEIVARRPDLGSVVVGTEEGGRIIVFLRGQTLDHPDRLQIHFAVANVDAEFERLRRAGVKFREPPKDMPWRWRHAYTSDPAGHTIEICSPLPGAGDQDSTFVR